MRALVAMTAGCSDGATDPPSPLPRLLLYFFYSTLSPPQLRWDSARFAMQSLYEEGARLRQCTNDLLVLLPQLEDAARLGGEPDDNDESEVSSWSGSTSTRSSLNSQEPKAPRRWFGLF